MKPDTAMSCLAAPGLAALILAWLLVLAAGCAETPPESSPWRTMVVNATAYTSRPMETDDTPREAAWGDRLEPGMKAIAVSRDLLHQGLTRDTRVRVEGLEGEYRVLDKMHQRWRRRIDIYFGNNVEAARRWGRQEVFISWLGDDPDDGG